MFVQLNIPGYILQVISSNEQVSWIARHPPASSSVQSWNLKRRTAQLQAFNVSSVPVSVLVGSRAHLAIREEKVKKKYALTWEFSSQGSSFYIH